MSLQEYLDGKVILIDKPLEWTSFQVVNKIRWHLRKKLHVKKIKVGHAGTLDPLATGLLVLCTGKFTKKIESFQAKFKEYTGEITLGATTPSFDMETEVNAQFPTEHITNELIAATAEKFVGEIAQAPPIFSAIKKDGKRLYTLAREGKTVEVEKRNVTIFEFEITAIELPKVSFRVVCSKGTYIRSLANDFGQALNSGGYLSRLRRTKIGELSVDDAIDPVKYVETYLS